MHSPQQLTSSTGRTSKAADDDPRDLELTPGRAPHVAEPMRSKEARHRSGAVGAHLDQEPASLAEPLMGLGGGALDEPEPVLTVVGERVDRLRLPDLDRKGLDLALPPARGMGGADVDLAR